MFKLLVNTELLLVIFPLLCGAVRNDQPQFQVSLHVRLNPKWPSVHSCNGIIIQSRLVLTTASCLHYRYDSTTNATMSIIDPTAITVRAGSVSDSGNVISAQVTNVRVFDKFRIATNENDIAVLTLIAALPLNKRNDMAWIILDSPPLSYDSCYANIAADNVEKIEVISHEECQKVAKQSQFALHEEGVCSNYTLPPGLQCNIGQQNMSPSSKRGTGLVCRGRLSALLSTLISPSTGNATNCGRLSTKTALFTPISPYLGWIYDIIATEERKAIISNNYVESLPFQEDWSASSKKSSRINFTSENDMTEIRISPVTAWPTTNLSNVDEHHTTSTARDLEVTSTSTPNKHRNNIVNPTEVETPTHSIKGGTKAASLADTPLPSIDEISEDETPQISIEAQTLRLPIENKILVLLKEAETASSLDTTVKEFLRSNSTELKDSDITEWTSSSNSSNTKRSPNIHVDHEAVLWQQPTKSPDNSNISLPIDRASDASTNLHLSANDILFLGLFLLVF